MDLKIQSNSVSNTLSAMNNAKASAPKAEAAAPSPQIGPAATVEISKAAEELLASKATSS